MEPIIDATQVGDTATRFAARGDFLTPHRGRGKELCDLLRKELGIPDGVRSFEVRFAHEDVVTVRCEYMPRAARDETDTRSNAPRHAWE